MVRISLVLQFYIEKYVRKYKNCFKQKGFFSVMKRLRLWDNGLLDQTKSKFALYKHELFGERKWEEKATVHHVGW